MRSLRAARIRDQGLDLSGVAEDPLDDLRPEDRLFEAALVKAVQIEPRNFYYRDFLGDFYLRRGFEERALAHVRVSTRLHPVLDRHFYLSYLVTVSPAVLSAVEQGVQEALESDETQVSAYDIHRFLADIHLRMGRLDRAMASLESAAGRPSSTWRCMRITRSRRLIPTSRARPVLGVIWIGFANTCCATPMSSSTAASMV